MDPALEGIHSEDDLSTDEKALAKKWKLDLEQVAWMRWSIRDECENDFDKFQEDYPFDPESAFRKSGRGRFDADALEFADTRAGRTFREFGILEYNERNDTVVFRATSEEEATVVRFEVPKARHRYLLACDPATGDSQTSGIDPDSNSAGVLRAGHVNENGHWVEPCVAMRTICYEDGVRFGNWWDTHILEEQIWRMQLYYGRCKTVVEENKDRGLIEMQKGRADVDIYQREVFNKRTHQITQQLGWRTDERTREAIISNLARALTEAGTGKHGTGIDVRCPWIVAQLKNFVVKASGRSEAAKGKHDDDVLMLAIGLYLIEQATTYHVPVEERPAILFGYDGDSPPNPSGDVTNM
jgi:hypothetical protein